MHGAGQDEAGCRRSSPGYKRRIARRIPAEEASLNPDNSMFQGSEHVHQSRDGIPPRLRHEPSSKETRRSHDPGASRSVHPRSLKSKNALRTHEADREFECMVCMSDIVFNQPGWSCTTCFKLFHLRCMHQWIRQSVGKSKQLPETLEWRCPGCQYVYLEKSLPKYMCFCGRMENPPSSRERPFSCNEPCSRQRRECSHPCVLQCHPGACPPCTALLPKASCFCGAQAVDGSNVRCGDARSAEYSCGGICGKILNCGKHKCTEQCHEKCEVCKEIIGSVSCECGCENRKFFCGESVPSSAFSCGKLIKGVRMDCGIHFEDRICNDLNRECRLKPSKWGNKCACGKTGNDSLLPVLRMSCEDPIPTCSEPTERLLDCGHKVSVRCTLDAGKIECNEKIVQFCRCSKIKRTISCHEAASTSFLCTQSCKTYKTCLKCKCDQICCPCLGRQDFGAEPHICFTVCGKTLNCKIHNCDQIHHLGKCKPCGVICRDTARSCNCGKTVLNPPFLCGTLTPPCMQICNKLMACGHPDLNLCHTDPVCAPCTLLVSKPCAGGHENLHQIPCFAENVSCSRKCGKLLSCGKHGDKNACHAGPCQICTQLCDAKLSFCEHQCLRECSHASACDEEPCRARITVSCPCGLKIEEVLCRANANNPFPASLEISCSSDCAAAQRLAVLRHAFREEEEVGSGTDFEKYSGELLMLAEKFDKFVRLLDASLCSAVDARSRTLHLPPSDQLKRYLTLEYVQIHYRFEAEVVKEGDGPHVVVHFVGGETRIPNPTLTQMLGMQPSQTLKYTVDFSEDGPKIHLYDVARGFGRLTIERVNQVLKPWIGAYRTRRAEGFNVFLDFFDANKAVAAFRKLQSASGLEQCTLVNVSLFTESAV